MILNYLKIKGEYQKLEEVNCPFLNEVIKFNAKGFRHLMYKNHARKRSELDVIQRSKYFQVARTVLSITTTLQETEIIKKSKMYGFIAIVGDLKLKVIIKKDGEGSWYFFSIIPHYVTSPKRDGHSGNKKTV